jgi:hypothetical protein
VGLEWVVLGRWNVGVVGVLVVDGETYTMAAALESAVGAST